ncbi:MAG: hotdog fold thioesterase [Gammaproteobacteria bacterium]
MSIWKNPISLEQVRQLAKNTMIEHLGIVITEIGDDYLKASMPVSAHTHQPMGILHGGATVALAETIGSFASQMAAAPGQQCVGLEINANHLRSVRSGLVYAVASPIHIGRSTQVWEIRISDEEGRSVTASRLTVAVLEQKKL